MGHSNGIITYPAEISDIQQVLGDQGSEVIDGVTVTGSLGALCKSTRINMWAKYKPVRILNRLDTTDEFDFANQKWLSTATWWHGLNSEFGGITAPSGVSTPAALIALYDGDMNGWVYNQPQGGIHPYRQWDFCGYNHNALKAVENFYAPGRIVCDGHFTASALMSMPDANGDYISLADFSSFNVGSLYFGVWIVEENGTPTSTRCTSTDAGVAGVLVNMENSGNVLQPYRNYKVYPFLSNRVLNITDTADPTGLLIYPCPNVNPVSVYTVNRNDMADISIEAAYRMNDSTIIDITITNDDAQAYANCQVFLMPMTYWSDPGPNTSHAVKSSLTFTLMANEEKIMQFTNVSSGNYFIYATFSNGTYDRKTNILQNIDPQ